MNKFLYMTVPFILLSLSSGGQTETSRGMEFFHGSFEEALEKAEEEDKLVFVDVYTTWCGPCKVMAQTVFPDQEVGEYFNARFINFKLDAEDETIDGPRISNTYDVSAYPTLLFLNPDGTEIGRGVAGYDKEGFLSLAENVLSKQSPDVELLAQLSVRYDEGERERDFVQQYLYTASLVHAGNYNTETRMEHSQKMGPIFEEYIETHRENDTTLINEKDFQLIRSYAARRPKSHPAVAFVVENYDSFKKVVPEFSLNYFVIECNYSTVMDLAQAGDKSYVDHIALLDTDLAQAHSMIAAEDPASAILKDQLIPRARTEYLIGTQDWAGYTAQVKQKLENAEDEVARARIMGRAANRLMNSGEEQYVQIGDEWATKAYQVDKTEPINVMNYSSVLIKLRNLEAALEVYEEMLATLVPSSPHYNFRDYMEASIARVKEMMNVEEETDTDRDTDT